MLRIAFVTLHTNNLSYTKYTIPAMKEYCLRHGYSFIEYTESLDKLRYAPWSKYLAILDTISTNEYDWVFWCDADAAPINHIKKLEDYIDNKYDIIIDTLETPTNNLFNQYCYEEKCNTGLWFAKCSTWTVEFIKNIYYNNKYVYWYAKEHSPWEQSPFNISLAYDNHLEPKKHIKCLMPMTLQSYSGFTKLFFHPFGLVWKPLLANINKHIIR